DNDPWGRSDLLVNVFDYSGEVTEGALSTLNDEQRRRALKADGYIFFLDPTEPLENQKSGLTRLRRDLRVTRKVRPNRSLQTPVALCVSKIDYVASMAPDFAGHFNDELRRIDTEGEDMSMEFIEARSDLALKLCRRIWPGWDIERLIRDLFGGRYRFFPLTPISLDVPENVSPDDLRDRAVDPFGIVEPLVWLLHMNGYPILKE
ncbi:MAG: hypothetical protein ABIP48_15390, partial [Planctomycetota bacterium]